METLCRNIKLVDLIKEEFEKRISKKTGWGKKEIMIAFSDAVSSAAMRLLDEKE